MVAIAAMIALGAIALGSVRSLGRKPHATFDEPLEAAPDARIIFWCQACGTELLLLRKGSEKPPRHCGEAMVEREEV